MRELLRRVHGSPAHGAAPIGRRRTTLRGARCSASCASLRRAIEQEQFELAAELRDRIRVLE